MISRTPIPGPERCPGRTTAPALASQLPNRTEPAPKASLTPQMSWRVWPAPLVKSLAAPFGCARRAGRPRQI